MSATILHSPRAFVGAMCCYVLNRGHGLNQGHARIVIFLAACCLATSASAGILPDPGDAEEIHFIVAELPGREVVGGSYVITIDADDDESLHHAHILLDWAQAGGRFTDPIRPRETIVVAGIDAGSDGVNRDMSANGAPPWSWHITEFHGFGDAVAGTLDGNGGGPAEVEQDVDFWIGNTTSAESGTGTIGFVRWTIVGILPYPDAPDGIHGDINQDDSVNRADIAEFVTHFGQDAGANWASGDFDHDDKTALSDLALLQSNIGETALPDGIGIGIQSVPEPNTMALLFAGAASLLASRRRRRG